MSNDFETKQTNFEIEIITSLIAANKNMTPYFQKVSDSKQFYLRFQHYYVYYLTFLEKSCRFIPLQIFTLSSKYTFLDYIKNFMISICE